MKTPMAPRAVSALELATRLRAEKRVLAVSHEAPDGDALGCLAALAAVCERLGMEFSAYVPGTAGFPAEYLFLPGLDGVTRGGPPPVTADTTVYFLDCASALRGEDNGFAGKATRVNIDHHEDNPGYAELNLIDPSAPSTSAILFEVFRAGGLSVDARVATALYVGLVTDTGRFQYSNTTPYAHRMAADLQEAGCDVVEVYRRIYESTPLPKLMLLQRALGRIQVRLGGALAVSWLGNDDFAEVGADEGHAEGLIDTLRQIRGVQVVALAREKADAERVVTKVSLRSTDGGVDVAAIAHERGGGGHVRAAGFTSEKTVSETLAWIEARVKAAL
jgi:phosphoesterase RecJ-like protein